MFVVAVFYYLISSAHVHKTIRAPADTLRQSRQHQQQQQQWEHMGCNAFAVSVCAGRLLK